MVRYCAKVAAQTLSLSMGEVQKRAGKGRGLRVLTHCQSPQRLHAAVPIELVDNDVGRLLLLECLDPLSYEIQRFIHSEANVVVQPRNHPPKQQVVHDGVSELWDLEHIGKDRQDRAAVLPSELQQFLQALHQWSVMQFFSRPCADPRDLATSLQVVMDKSAVGADSKHVPQVENGILDVLQQPQLEQLHQVFGTFVDELGGQVAGSLHDLTHWRLRRLNQPWQQAVREDIFCIGHSHIKEHGKAIKAARALQGLTIRLQQQARQQLKNHFQLLAAQIDWSPAYTLQQWHCWTEQISMSRDYLSQNARPVQAEDELVVVFVIRKIVEVAQQKLQTYGVLLFRHVGQDGLDPVRGHIVIDGLIDQCVHAFACRFIYLWQRGWLRDLDYIGKEGVEGSQADGSCASQELENEVEICEDLRWFSEREGEVTDYITLGDLRLVDRRRVLIGWVCSLIIFFRLHFQIRIRELIKCVCRFIGGSDQFCDINYSYLNG